MRPGPIYAEDQDSMKSPVFYSIEHGELSLKESSGYVRLITRPNFIKIQLVTRFECENAQLAFIKIGINYKA